MTPYNFQAIEQKWQQYWEDQKTYRTDTNPHQPKYYILDMFPYPSGEGLHVGHPLGYIATDIIARYKRSRGYAVLHPMGFDAFGLPAEQYAIQTGQHPATTTAKNIQRYQQQLRQLGLSYDWDRAVTTSDPTYYKWTQWIFLQLFNSWYNTQLQQARPIKELVAIFEQQGNQQVQASCDKDVAHFTATQWQAMDKSTQEQHLLAYRLAFLENTIVNWCPELGTVLANEEVKDGLSERGGYPVIRKQMKQWSLRITAYADRLLAGLDHLNWPVPTKEMQRNWIGKSVGAEINFTICECQGETSTLDKANGQQHTITVFTTRPDTIFGVTFITLSPEHPLATTICTPAQKANLDSYITTAINRSERDRLADNKVTGVFTGAYALHPFTKKPIPIWVGDYVLASYGTGAVIGAPAHDSRDYAFAKQFQLPIIQVISGGDIRQAVHEEKEGYLINSDFLNGLSVQAATLQIIHKLTSLQIGRPKVTYRLRNAIFSRQRYWGEPFPIYYQEGLPYALAETELPLELPTLTNYKPTATGEPPLGNTPNWKTKEGYPLELNTMPGWAGSSWYFLRFMDPHNGQQLVSPAAQSYWQAVDLYVGGAEHATGHLLYARFWTQFLYDLGHVNVEEPFQQLIHQGMIQGKSSLAYRIKGTNQFVSYNLRQGYETTAMHVAIDLVDKNNVLQQEAFKKWRPDLADATFILENGRYICGSEVEKMSKSKHNIVSPDQIVAQYGADTLRLYTMFLGPIDQAKPWDMHGIEGICRFLVKVWRLFHLAQAPMLTMEAPRPAVKKVIHQTIKKVSEAIERHSFNTAISHLMICVNELTALQCTNKQVLQQFAGVLAPFAPHLAEEVWQLLGYTSSITQEPFPIYEEAYLQEESYEYPVAINGKLRAKITFPLTMEQKEIERAVITHEGIQKWIQGRPIEKIIIVSGKMINIVI